MPVSSQSECYPDTHKDAPGYDYKQGCTLCGFNKECCICRANDIDIETSLNLKDDINMDLNAPHGQHSNDNTVMSQNLMDDINMDLNAPHGQHSNDNIVMSQNLKDNINNEEENDENDTMLDMQMQTPDLRPSLLPQNIDASEVQSLFNRLFVIHGLSNKSVIELTGLMVRVLTAQFPRIGGMVILKQAIQEAENDEGRPAVADNIGEGGPMVAESGQVVAVAAGGGGGGDDDDPDSEDDDNDNDNGNNSDGNGGNENEDNNNNANEDNNDNENGGNENNNNGNDDENDDDNNNGRNDNGNDDDGNDDDGNDDGNDDDDNENGNNDDGNDDGNDNAHDDNNDNGNGDCLEKINGQTVNNA